MSRGKALLLADIAEISEHISATRASEGLQRVRLEDDAVHIQMIVCEAFRSSDAPLRLVLGISELSGYPSSGALLFVEDGGSETIDGIVEEVASSLGSDVRLQRVLRKLCEAFMVEARFPAPSRVVDEGTGASSGGEVAAASEGSASDGDSSDDDDGDGDDDDDDEDDGDYGYDELLEETDWESLQRIKRRWEEKESERSAKRQAVGGKPVGMSAGHKPGAPAGAPAAAPRNEMFSSRESFRMLSNELFQIISNSTSRDGEGTSAEAVDDDVHHWRVRLSGFSGSLGEDLKNIETLYGYNYVEIDFTFTPDLHPFYPPQVKIVRPRFKGWVLGAVMTHPMFVLSGWDPMRSTQAVIDHVRELLQSFGRIEIDTERNDADAFPDSAYSRLENVLIQMELLTSTRPRAADRYPDMYADREKEINKDRLKIFRNLGKKDEKDKKGKDGQKQYWASGTGYGHSGADKGEIWDSKAAAAAQKHQDELRANMLQELLSEDIGSDEAAGVAGGGGAGGGGAAASTDRTETSLLAGLAEAGPRERDFVLDSCLVPFLETEILQTTLQDMGVRFSYYTAVIKAAQRCFELEWLRPNLSKLADGLAELAEQSAIFQVSVGGREFADKVEAARQAEASGGGSGRATASYDLMPKGMARKPKAQAELAGWQQMNELLNLADAVQRVANCSKDLLASDETQATATTAAAAKCSLASAAAGAAAASDPSELGQQYSAALDSLRFQFVPELAQIAGVTGGAAAAGRPSGGSGRMRRLASEAASCQKNLPLDLSSSCFVRVDENRIDHWHALITGPEDTPYEGGCFIFDILCGSEYPNSAPKVLLFTTGGGTVRFNPNLYNCGKVCLSLLGTWSGGQGEQWDPNVSSLLQVLISIQALIFVPQPYFNEPGYESSIGTPEGDRKSFEYNAVIREATLKYAILDMLKNPKPGFEEVIKLHFKHRKVPLLKTLHGWVEEATKKPGRTYYAGNLRKLVGEVEKLLKPL